MANIIIEEAIDKLLPYTIGSLEKARSIIMPHYVNPKFEEVDSFQYRAETKSISDFIHNEKQKLFIAREFPVYEKFNELDTFFGKTAAELEDGMYIPHIELLTYDTKTNQIVGYHTIPNEVKFAFDGYDMYAVIDPKYTTYTMIHYYAKSIRLVSTIDHNTTHFSPEEYSNLSLTKYDFVPISDTPEHSKIAYDTLVKVDSTIHCSFITNTSIPFATLYFESAGVKPERGYYTAINKILDLCDDSYEEDQFLTSIRNHVYNDDTIQAISCQLNIDKDDTNVAIRDIIKYDISILKKIYSSDKKMYTNSMTGAEANDRIKNHQGTFGMAVSPRKFNHTVALIFVNGMLYSDFNKIIWHPSYFQLPPTCEFEDCDIIDIVYIFGISGKAPTEFQFEEGKLYSSDYEDYEFFTNQCDKSFPTTVQDYDTLYYKLPIEFDKVSEDSYKGHMKTVVKNGYEIEYKNIGTIIRCPKNNFQYASYRITNSTSVATYGISLPSAFRYSQDIHRYMVFINGYKVDNSRLALVVPDPSNPFDELALFMQYVLHDGDILSIFYLPFPLLFATAKINDENMSVDFLNDSISYYINSDNGIAFIDGIKIPKNYVKAISRDKIQLLINARSTDSAEFMFEESVIDDERILQIIESIEETKSFTDLAISNIADVDPNIIYSKTVDVNYINHHVVEYARTSNIVHYNAPILQSSNVIGMYSDMLASGSIDCIVSTCTPTNYHETSDWLNNLLVDVKYDKSTKNISKLLLMTPRGKEWVSCSSKEDIINCKLKVYFLDMIDDIYQHVAIIHYGLQVSETLSSTITTISLYRYDTINKTLEFVKSFENTDITKISQVMLLKAYNGIYTVLFVPEITEMYPVLRMYNTATEDIREIKIEYDTSTVLNIKDITVQLSDYEHKLLQSNEDIPTRLHISYKSSNDTDVFALVPTMEKLTTSILSESFPENESDMYNFILTDDANNIIGMYTIRYNSVTYTVSYTPIDMSEPSSVVNVVPVGNLSKYTSKKRFERESCCGMIQLPGDTTCILYSSYGPEAILYLDNGSTITPSPIELNKTDEFAGYHFLQDVNIVKDRGNYIVYMRFLDSTTNNMNTSSYKISIELNVYTNSDAQAALTEISLNDKHNKFINAYRSQSIGLKNTIVMIYYWKYMGDNTGMLYTYDLDAVGDRIGSTNIYALKCLSTDESIYSDEINSNSED